jgi:hypothetical protein
MVAAEGVVVALGEMEKVMKKLVRCLSVIAVSALAALDSPQPTMAGGNLPARGGKSDISEPACWGVFGPTVTNNCSQSKFWYMPLVNVAAGRFWVTVTAQGASISSDVMCFSTGANRNGTIFWFSPTRSLPQFGPATDIHLDTAVPSGGSGMVDCQVLPGGRLHTLSW